MSLPIEVPAASTICLVSSGSTVISSSLEVISSTFSNKFFLV
jgi:hypothetical protein